MSLEMMALALLPDITLLRTEIQALVLVVILTCSKKRHGDTDSDPQHL